MAASTPERPRFAPCVGPGSANASPRHSGRLGPLTALALLPILASAQPLFAQEPALARLEGRVVRGQEDSLGVGLAVVVLHLVTPDTAGEIDTTRADVRGSFAFDLPSVPDPLVGGEVYFASVDHDGILYFGPPVHEAGQLDGPYLIEVHDTAVAPREGSSLPLRVRYLVLEPGDQGWVVTDVFQVENPGERTLVAADDGIVWSYPLPPGIVELDVGGDDAAPDAVEASDGVLRVSAPVAPGMRQFMLRYRLGQPLLDLPLPGPVEVVELLVREPGPPLSVQGLMVNRPVEMEPGVTYRRYSGLDLEDARVRVLPGTESDPFPVEWLAVVLALVLTGGALWALNRGVPATAAGPREGARPAGEEALRGRLVLEVASLDERLESEALDERERTGLLKMRADLIDRIRRIR